jgi:hypothetical protein
MADKDNIVLRHLRHIRGAADGLCDDMREVRQRIGSLETEAACAERFVERIELGLGRIERRLGLVEA